MTQIKNCLVTKFSKEFSVRLNLVLLAEDVPGGKQPLVAVPRHRPVPGIRHSLTTSILGERKYDLVQRKSGNA